MLSILLLFTAYAWDYKHEGADWTGECTTGRLQSPINITPSVTNKKTLSSTAKHVSIGFELSSQTVSGLFNNHTYKIKGEFGTLRAYNHKDVWIHSGIIDQLHFHSPSETYLNNTRYDLEMHIVMNYTGKYFRNLVYSVLFNVGEENDFIKFVIDSNNASAQISLEEILNKERVNDYFLFKGSLTTPPCTEIVMWLVDEEIRTVSSEQLKFFTSRWSENVDFANGNGNNRAVQPVNKREIFHYASSFAMFIIVGLGYLAI